MLQFPCFRLFPEGEPPGGTFRFGALGFGFFGLGLRFNNDRKKRAKENLKIENAKLKEDNEEKEKKIESIAK